MSQALAARAADTPSFPGSGCVPTTQQLNAGFELAGIGRLGAGYPHLPRIGVDSAMVPPDILRAIAWIESNWQQFDSSSLPLLSPDYGYGVMQITSGMAGAAGPTGSLPMNTQARIGGDYLFNVAYAARLLAKLFKVLPTINDGDPTRLENWYYAIWAYNGWGAANNPNDAGFTRKGNPLTQPWNFPYQERVYYLIEHPPVDSEGRRLWSPMRVTLPQRASIGQDPGPITISPTHQELPHIYGATYDVPQTLTEMHARSSLDVTVRVYNTSGVPWPANGSQPPFGLTYHWVKSAPQSASGYDPSLHGVDVLDGSPVPLSSTVGVGGSIEVTIPLMAPSSPGTYTLDWDMWSKASGWFSHNSVPPGRQTVTVEPAGVTVPPYEPPNPPAPLRGNHARLVRVIDGDVPATMRPGESYSRTVLLFNPGGAGWNKSYGLEEVGSSTVEPLPSSFVGACRTIPATIQGTAPATPGTYVVRWRLVSGSGTMFGPTFPLQFSVSTGK